jgi:hypothetical protein
LRTRYRALVIILVLVGICAWFLHNGQYKLDPLQAAKSSSQVGKDAGLFGQVDYPWGKIYLFKTNQGSLSVLVTKTGFLWQNQGVMRIKDTTDKVKTLCWKRVISGYSHEATVLAVESEDEKVAFIEAGKGSQRIKKEIKPGTPIIFSWDEALELTEVNATALSAEGTVLYDYRYPRNNPSVTIEDLRWYSTRR